VEGERRGEKAQAAEQDEKLQPPRLVQCPEAQAENQGREQAPGQPEPQNGLCAAQHGGRFAGHLLNAVGVKTLPDQQSEIGGEGSGKGEVAEQVSAHYVRDAHQGPERNQARADVADCQDRVVGQEPPRI